jgi:phosphatidylethanolamine-binding protein (PEBP) family uncharacterized protein
VLQARVAVAAALVVVAACSSSDGRELPPPKAVVTTLATVPSTIGPAIEGAAGFMLTSPVVADGGVLPVRHTCAGEDVSPPLAWTGAPAAASLAIVVRDVTAGDVHWVVTDIDPTVTGFGEAGVPETAVEAVAWSGPCPPAGSGTHSYVVALHALAEPLVVDPGATADDAAAAVEAGSIGQTQLQITATAA